MAAGGIFAGLGKQFGWAQEAAEESTGVRQSKLVVCRGNDATDLVQKSFDALGGVEKFVKPGNIVVVKPNIAWDRTPQLAANTNPEVVAEIVRLCKKAGAKEVKVFDRSCNDARRTYETSGIAEAARNQGADVSHIDDRKFKTIPFPDGKMLKEWEVYGDVLDADVFINVPIAKHHSLTNLTLSMKNHFGVVGGRRGLLHQDIHQKIADLSTEIKPHLNIVDATRILKANGPTGGNPQDVQLMNTLVVSTDAVAADSFSATLFGMKGEDVGYVKIANEMGLGRMYPNEIQAEEIVL